NNTAYKKGGAVYNAGTMEIQSGSSFAGNSTTWDGQAGSGGDTNANGGAIWNSGTLILGDNITFSNNSLSSQTTNSTYGHGSDIYNNGGTIQIGNNLNITRDELGTTHDCAVFVNGGNVSIGDNASFSNVVEALITRGNAQVTIGDNLHVSNVYNGIASWGDTLSIGKNATFERVLSSRVLQTVKSGNSITVGDGLVVRNNGTTSFGTLYNEASSTMRFLGSTEFTNNQSPWNNAGVFQNFNGSLVFDGEASFTGNMANGDGGALRNRNASSSAEFKEGAVFTGNKVAGNGGAVLNEGTLIFNDVTFSNNFAQGTPDFVEDPNGIWDDSEDENVHYSFVVTDGVKNDIHNTGNIIFKGNTVLDGGITGTGNVTVTETGTLNIGTAQVQADTLNFANGSTLGVTFTNDAMGNLQANTVNVDTTANLAVTLSRDFLTTDKVEYLLTNGTAVSGGDFVLSNTGNALYDISLDTDTYTVTTSRKSATDEEKVIADAGGNENTVAVVNAFTSAGDLGSEAANKPADLINQLAQTDVPAVVRAAKALAPEETYTRQVVHTVNMNELFSAVGTHIASVTGGNNAAPRMYALGDQGASYRGHNYSVWAQGLLNKSHKEATSTSAFTGRSTGLAGGFDKTWDDTWLTGLGYAY
ncbi:MAG: hypothetical protein IKO35_02790, partial [Elusimicrobiaceae bacterium]|nr:hypothetical protein [Elusimicrobiaceae bacterium]